MIQTVDLASRFSAVVLRSRDGEIHRQFDSRNKTHFEFAAEVGRINALPEVELTVVEDVPYGISSQAMVKPVLKFQGVIMTMCHRDLDKVLFCAPATWMKDFPGVQRAPKGLSKSEADKYRIEQARLHAAHLGYSPPDLVQEYLDSLPEGTKALKKHTNPLEKSMTDYVSSFLMNHFVTSRTEEEFRGLQGVSPAYI